MSKRITALCICLVVSTGIAFGAIRLPGILSNNMVLQQQSRVALWGTANANAEVRVNTSWNKKEYKTTADGSGKWKVLVSTPKAGGPYEISFSDGSSLTLTNILIGEVWVCSGQSNMEMTFRGFGPTTQPIINQPGVEATMPMLRLFTVGRAPSGELKEDVKGSWKQSDSATAKSFSAVAYQFGKLLWDSLKVPVGLIATSWGGARIEHWMSEESLKAFPEIPVPPASSIDTMKTPEKAPTSLFNGMIFPLLNFSIRGILWYQGESSRDQPIQYQQLFKVMVADWRARWHKKDMPFYYVQIAPYTYAGDKNPFYSVLMREAQFEVLPHVPYSGMAVTLDVGSELKIHPPDKTTVAKRLGYIALAKTYGRKDIPYLSPSYRSIKIQGDKAILSFDHAEHGLKSSGSELAYFEIAGADKVFYPATAKIIPGGKVEVSSTTVKSPVAVRYAFKNWVRGDLFNTEGLPASSFRTDHWDIPPFTFK